MHFHHAFVLDSVGYDMTGKAVSMTLVNPGTTWARDSS